MNGTCQHFYAINTVLSAFPQSEKTNMVRYSLVSPTRKIWQPEVVDTCSLLDPLRHLFSGS